MRVHGTAQRSLAYCQRVRSPFSKWIRGFSAEEETREGSCSGEENLRDWTVRSTTGSSALLDLGVSRDNTAVWLAVEFVR